ncbi:hypothetical protein JHS3_29320 [Jeongeupia sp. HS-3]|uniref:hypothetical protein n=1 Tax=Jeongeupia sp. HS-3 TaxID=1009682 RepID=UPI0018A4C9E8|nr:hypothetical protein [Jeongeupia sp. HS-3]BCL77196.1 hypothetical protein JHS3_29320 [Jeongeupia sp. HS-3]
MRLPARQDWPLLSKALLVLLLGLGAGLALCYATWRHRDAAQLKFNQALSQLVTMQNQVDDARAQLEHLGNYQHEYALLRRRGAIGVEHRLEWVEYLNAEASRRPGLSYQIGARRALPGVDAQNGLQLFASKLDVRFTASDETGWSSFNAGLRRLPGWAAEGACQIARSPNKDVAALSVDCSYEWLSIDRAEVAE